MASVNKAGNAKPKISRFIALTQNSFEKTASALLASHTLVNRTPTEWESHHTRFSLAHPLSDDPP